MLTSEQKNNVLTISRNNVPLFRFTCGELALSTALGRCSYKMNRGSFNIKDTITPKTDLFISDITQEENKFILKLTEGKLEIELSGDILKFTPVELDKYNRMFIYIPADKNEHIYGAGETFSEFDLRGNKFNVWVAEHQNMSVISKKLLKIALGDTDSEKKMSFEKYETYYAQPTFLSSKKYFFHSDTTARAVFDFKAKEKHIIETDSIASYYLGFGDDFEEVLFNLTSLLGRQPELPDWVFDGYILGIQGGTDIMMNKVKNALDAGIKVNGVWIQDWEGRRITAAGKQLMWNWEHDKELYPSLPEKIKELNEIGIKVLGYCNPFLAIEKPLYKIAHNNGYCVKDINGNDYLVKITTFPAAMVDLTNPEAYNWLKGIIKTNMIDFGLSGWMADFGEYLPTDCVLFSGEDAQLAHNTWPARWAKLNREVVEESGKLGEIMFFTRSGFTGTGRYSTMMWNGDNHVDFSLDNGLPSVIPAMLSLTCSGFGLSHSDIAGYTTFGKLRRSKELYMRWCEMNAFSLVMRGHEGINPDINVQLDYDNDVLAIGAEASRIHLALKPYLKEAVKYNAEKGVGVIRPLFFYYDEEEAYNEKYEYLLGRDILVAPVFEAGAKTKRVYLPNDNWIHIASKREYGGGYAVVEAPLGHPAVFVRKEASKELLQICMDMDLSY
ncbi:MAG: alpha-glucosidase [Oscillospiraceae bacterium]|nr:alpha-glucosidase [Oscillospiraceae bacterium]